MCSNDIRRTEATSKVTIIKATMPVQMQITLLLVILLLIVLVLPVVYY